ncbi:MAG: hypothetical protein KAS93_05850 [Gammaproteobacteria bacterium]|nr:hypothetical protein [Gammaproteobacteria bacterium]
MLDFENSLHPIGFANTLLACKRTENGSHCIELQSDDEQRKLWQLFPVLESNVFFINGKTSRILNNDAITYLEKYCTLNKPPVANNNGADSPPTYSTRELLDRMPQNASTTDITRLSFDETEHRLEELHGKDGVTEEYETLLTHYRAQLKNKYRIRINRTQNNIQIMQTYYVKQNEYLNLIQQRNTQQEKLPKHREAWYEIVLEYYKHYFDMVKKRISAQEWFEFHILYNKIEKVQQTIKKNPDNIDTSFIINKKSLLSQVIKKGDDYFEMAKLLILQAHAYPLGKKQPEELLMLANNHNNANRLKLLLLFYYLGLDDIDIKCIYIPDDRLDPNTNDENTESVDIPDEQLAINVCQITGNISLNDIKPFYSPFTLPLTHYLMKETPLLLQILREKTQTKIIPTTRETPLEDTREMNTTNIATKMRHSVATNKNKDSSNAELSLEHLYSSLRAFVELYSLENLITIKENESWENCITVTISNITAITSKQLQIINIFLSSLLFTTAGNNQVTQNIRNNNIKVSISFTLFEHGNFNVDTFYDSVDLLGELQQSHKKNILDLLAGKKQHIKNPKHLIKYLPQDTSHLGTNTDPTTHII